MGLVLDSPPSSPAVYNHKMEKKKKTFKDNKGHTIYLVSEADAIRCKCPYCKEIKDFEKAVL